MVSNVGISLYVARIRRKRDEEYLPLNGFAAGTDFFEFLWSQLRGKQNQFLDMGDGPRRIQIRSDLEKNAKDRVLQGTLDVGEYGRGGSLKDAKSGTENYRRQPTDADMIPLFYRIWCPKDQRFAAFALQNYGHLGSKTAIYRLLDRAFKEQFPDFLLEMREAIPKRIMLDFVKKGQVKEFRFLQAGVPRDWADGYGGSALEDSSAELQVIVKSKGKPLPVPQRLMNFFTGGAVTRGKLMEFHGFQAQKFKMIVEIGGKKRVLSHAGFLQMHGRIDVDSEVKFNRDGFPTRESLEEVAEALLAEIAKDVSLT
jgi:hypothetical protein